MTRSHYSISALLSLFLAASTTSAAALRPRSHSANEERRCTFTAYQKQICPLSHTTHPEDASSARPWTFFSIPSIRDVDGKLIVDVLSKRPESEHNSLTQISSEKAWEIGVPAERLGRGELVVQAGEEEFGRVDALTVRVDGEGNGEDDVLFGFRGLRWTSEDEIASGRAAWCEPQEWDMPCLHCGGEGGKLPRARFMNCTFSC